MWTLLRHLYSLTTLVRTKVDFNWLFQDGPLINRGLMISPKDVHQATIRRTYWIEIRRSHPEDRRAFRDLPSFSREPGETTKLIATTITVPAGISMSRDYRPTYQHD